MQIIEEQEQYLLSLIHCGLQVFFVCLALVRFFFLKCLLHDRTLEKVAKQNVHYFLLCLEKILLFYDAMLSGKDYENQSFRTYSEKTKSGKC